MQPFDLKEFDKTGVFLYIAANTKGLHLFPKDLDPLLRSTIEKHRIAARNDEKIPQGYKKAKRFVDSDEE